jgi:hypothetical protein
MTKEERKPPNAKFLTFRQTQVMVELLLECMYGDKKLASTYVLELAQMFDDDPSARTDGVQRLAWFLARCADELLEASDLSPDTRSQLQRIADRAPATEADRHAAEMRAMASLEEAERLGIIKRIADDDVTEASDA